MKKRIIILTIFGVFLMVFQSKAQSIELIPGNINPVNIRNSAGFIDVRKSGTDNHSGLRFFQNNTSKGGIFYNDNKEYFNLSGNMNIAGMVWSRNNYRLGIGVFEPEAPIHVLNNSTASVPHILVKENNNADGARINFENFGIADKRWTLFGRNTDTQVPSANLFNIFHSEFGNVAQFFGDGNTAHNGFTKLGSDAPNIKMKKIAGTTANASSQEISTGIAFDKIIDFEVLIEATVQDGLTTSRYKFRPANNNISGNDYRAFLRRITNPLQLNNFGWIQFENVSNTLRQQPYIIFITYEE